MNLSDSERLVSVLNDMGMSRTENEEEASIVGIVACSVRQKAIDRVYSRIHKWNKWKHQKPLLTFVTGCVLPSDREKFMKLFDIVFPMNELPELPAMIQQYGIVMPGMRPVLHEHSPEEDSVERFWKITPQYNSVFEAFIPIQNGCDKFCSFCAVPYTRGREVSRPSSEILAEVRDLVEKGYKSITLLGQNVNSYGLDKKGEEILFPELLRRIGEFGNQSRHEFWTYFTSPHPRDMTEEVIDVIAAYPVLAKQIHLPLQSGDDRMLIRMNRKYKVEQYRTVVQYIRQKLPSATLFTDIITGFTGETDEQFNNTLKIVQEFNYNMTFTAVYSPRPGAVSSRWADDIPLEVKKERLHILNEAVRKTSAAYNRSLLGKTLRILVTAKEERSEYLTGITEGKVIVRIASSEASLIGRFVDIVITGTGDFSVAGELVYADTMEAAR